MQLVLSIHVAAGGLALVLGAVALLVKKGGTIHRRSGLLFVCAMLVMGTTASILGNAGGGLMTVYLWVPRVFSATSSAVHEITPYRKTDPRKTALPHSRHDPSVCFVVSAFRTA